MGKTWAALIGRQRLDGPVLVQRHQSAVADDVSRQDDGETAIGFDDSHQRDPDSEVIAPFGSTTRGDIWRGV
jgi:hypothetical protein